jgi:hypothetical protein
MIPIVSLLTTTISVPEMVVMVETSVEVRVTVEVDSLVVALEDKDGLAEADVSVAVVLGVSKVGPKDCELERLVVEVISGRSSVMVTVTTLWVTMTG